MSRELERKDRKVLAYLTEVMDEYAKTYDSDFAEAKWVVAPDVSGSMCSPIGGSSVLSYAAVSAMFAGFFMKGLKDVTVLPWDTEAAELNVYQIFGWNDSVIDYMKFVLAKRKAA